MDLAQQLLLASQAALNFGDQVVGEAQVMERLFQDLGGMLRLAAITFQTLLRCATATLSGFCVFFGVSCAEGHGLLLCCVWGFGM